MLRISRHVGGQDDHSHGRLCRLQTSECADDSQRRQTASFPPMGDSRDKVGCRSGAMLTMPRNPKSPECDVVSARIGPEIALERHHRVHVQCFALPPRPHTVSIGRFESPRPRRTSKLSESPWARSSALRSQRRAPVRTMGARERYAEHLSGRAREQRRRDQWPNRPSKHGHGSTERIGRQTVQHAAANVEDTMNMNDHRRLEAIGHVTVLWTQYEPRSGYGAGAAQSCPPHPRHWSDGQRQ